MMTSQTLLRVWAAWEWYVSCSWTCCGRLTAEREKTLAVLAAAGGTAGGAEQPRTASSGRVAAGAVTAADASVPSTASTVAE